MPVAPPEPVVQKKSWAEKPYSRRQRRRDIGEGKLFSQLYVVLLCLCVVGCSDIIEVPTTPRRLNLARTPHPGTP